MPTVAACPLPAQKLARSLAALLAGAACFLVQAQSGSIETRKEWCSKVDQQQAEIERLKRENEALKSKSALPTTKGTAGAMPPPPLLEMDGLSAEAVKAGEAATAAHKWLPVVFFDRLKAGVQGPAMVVIPAGRFTIGSGDKERRKYVETGGKQEWADWEKPLSGVQVIPFALGQNEVTRAEYAAFVKATGRPESTGCISWNGAKWELNEELNWRTPGFDQADNHPVVCVSWEDAKAYAAWLSAETRQTYRLASAAAR